MLSYVKRHQNLIDRSPEIPTDSKLGVFDPFKAYQNLPSSSLPLELPAEYRAQICTILSEMPDTSSVANLSNAHRDSFGNLVIDGPVLNRPWEWTENLVSDDVNNDRGKETLKNSGSLSLQIFGSRMTSEVLPSPTKDIQFLNNSRFFEDRLSTSNIFQRDWRESRLKFRTRDDIEGAGKSKMDGSGRRQTSRAAPVSTSSHSRPSMRQSPGISRMAGSEVIDVDNFNLPTKRKNGNDSDGSDIEIIEGPVPVLKSSKKSKTKQSAKKATKKH